MPNTLVQLGGIIVMGNWNKLLVSFSWDFRSDRCQKSLSVEIFGHFSGKNFTLCPVSCLPESPMCRLIAQNRSLRYVCGLASEVWLHDSSLSGWKAPQKVGQRWKMAQNSQKRVFWGDDNLPVITVDMDTLALLVRAIGRYTLVLNGTMHVHPCQKAGFLVPICWFFTKSGRPDNHLLPHNDTSRWRQVLFDSSKSIFGTWLRFWYLGLFRWVMCILVKYSRRGQLVGEPSMEATQAKRGMGRSVTFKGPNLLFEGSKPIYIH